MKRHAAALLTVVSGIACGGDPPGAAQAGNSADEAPQAAPSTAVISPVPHASLAAFLPPALGPLTRSDVEEQTQNFMDATSHSVQADYATPGTIGLAPVGITIWDHGASEYMRTTYGILDVASEEETDSGFERHTRLRGHPTSESQSGSDARMEIWVADRYLVDITGRDMSVEDLREVAAALDLNGLANLAE